ncbi:NF-X1-type zinc finger protein NFXL1 isoform X2 [Cephus cinctus]|nr:NF-X1-type zinc finger protein NFXL1 isoform X2 [Cephus cinctus]
MEYPEDEVPTHYECFCRKTRDPSYLPWSIPHSCGETCSKLLQPKCGHRCVLLCHPGPCPPCPKMVSSKCYCGKQPARPRRCNVKEWSCGSICGKKLKCTQHNCRIECHANECPPCSETILVACHCGNKTEARKCNEACWTCDKPCGNRLSCNVHVCQGVCHRPDDCGECPTERNRSCPCGKTRYMISCKQEQVPTCGDTCGKLLDCGSHYCNMRCHTEHCGQCLEVVMKTCRCGAYKKELACAKTFHCDTKCKQMRLCGRHPCNKKCCDCLIKNNFNACEKICDRTLNCRKHKCAAPCHSGPCYPCPRTDVIQCRCGKSKITVPCGTAKKIKPPNCNKLCKIPPICHHPKRESHKCHQGACPPCRKVCGLTHKKCGHTCPAICHAKVWVKIKVNGVNSQPAGPWERPQEKMQLKTLLCPPCEVSVMVTCLGGHETKPWPCHMAGPTSCLRPCGQLLTCTNHHCEQLCHKLRSSGDSGEDADCEDCERECAFPRPKGCNHPCKKRCHPAPCDDCKQLVKVSCHCGINSLYKRCFELTSATPEQKNEMLKCGNQCPRIYPCGHRCIDNCHPGECQGASGCNKKVKLHCKCKRIKKDFSCALVRINKAFVDCDNVCQEKKEERRRAHELEMEKKRKEDEIKNQKEIEQFERKFIKSKRKGKDKVPMEVLKKNASGRMWTNIFQIVTVIILVAGLTIYATITD